MIKQSRTPYDIVISWSNGIDIEAIPFYPIAENLPMIIKLKLQCKELNFLFDKLQKSLLVKMESE